MRLHTQLQIYHVWLTIEIASAMQSYHMAKIILLLNEPCEPVVCRTALHERAEKYRRISREAEDHARKICGIAISRPDEATRIHMIQPLFVAGQCLQEKAERAVVVHYLREIEEELGWSTHTCVDQLLHMWGSR